MIETVEDAVRVVRGIQDRLEAQGELAGALFLCKATGAFYTTSSEALIGLLQALDQVSGTPGMEPWAARQIELVKSEVRKLLDLR